MQWPMQKTINGHQAGRYEESLVAKMVMPYAICLGVAIWHMLGERGLTCKLKSTGNGRATLKSSDSEITRQRALSHGHAS